MNNIVLFATYWNELEWIELSLEQILKIDPVEIIICDGNFDPRYENRSTDGTREIIQSFVKENSSRARMISAVRSKRYRQWFDFTVHAGRKKSVIYPSRLRAAARIQLKLNEYRINQALTFSKMMRMSNKWKLGRWVMSYDADQFYTDELIDFFSLTNDNNCEFDLITADEYTFPNNYSNYTEKYEKRKWNNMPHRIKENMAVYPTRHFMVETPFKALNYQDNMRSVHGGVYHHYKFRKDSGRLAAGYSLGDRKPPENDRFHDLKSLDASELPEIIRKRLF